MAAKENQGLQAIVIVLTILLLLTGVGLLFVNNARKTAVARAESAEKASSDAGRGLAEAQSEANSYKGWMGFEEGANLATLQPEFEKDSKRYGADMDEASRNYRAMLDNIFVENRVLGKNEANAKQQVKELNERLLAVEGEKEAQVKAFQAELNKAKADFAAEQVKFDELRKTTLAEKEKISGDMQKLQATQAETVAKMEAEQSTLKNTIAKLEHQIEVLREGLPEVDQFAQPADGRITWVNQRYAKVWIDLGSADGLRPQVTFSVAAAGNADAEAAEKKGSIEVVRILDDHMAEAQITSDDPKDPLLPGDRIYSQVWDRGRKVSFGIAGFIDLDKDRQSDLQRLKNIIAANGGEVAAAPDDSGKLQGELKVGTRYLVLGKYPEGTQPIDHELRESWKAVTKQAEQLGIETIPLDEFVKLMGWKVETRSVALDANSRPGDFPPQRREQDMPRKPVQPSGVFKPRLPPITY
jgi:hypothetical protein